MNLEELGASTEKLFDELVSHLQVALKDITRETLRDETKQAILQALRDHRQLVEKTSLADLVSAINQSNRSLTISVKTVRLYLEQTSITHLCAKDRPRNHSKWRTNARKESILGQIREGNTDKFEIYKAVFGKVRTPQFMNAMNRALHDLAEEYPAQTDLGKTIAMIRNTAIRADGDVMGNMTTRRNFHK